MRLESRVLTVGRTEQARRMHECRALGCHFLMFIPSKIQVIPNVNHRDQDPPRYSHSVFHRSDRDITNWPVTGATGVPLFTTWDSIAGVGRAPIPENISGRS